MKIGIIGYGAMGSAIAAKIKENHSVVIFDKDRTKFSGLRGIEVAKNSVDLVKGSDAIILAVKPQDFGVLLQAIRNDIGQKLVISIAAGKSTVSIESILTEAKVIRCMPNLPAQVGAGMICLCRGMRATEEELRLAEELFIPLGKVEVLEKEDLMDAATAVCGSGPGFFFDRVEGKTLKEAQAYSHIFIPQLAEAAEHIGFSHEQAIVLAETTTGGSITFLRETHLKPEEAKKLVVSKKGTTEAGLEALHKSDSLDAAVKAAHARSRELSGS